MYAREIPEARQRLAERGAQLARPLAANAPTNHDQAKRQAVMRENRVLLRGRYDDLGREVWDVVKIAGGEHRLYAIGLRFFPEAVELGRACMSGKTFVSLSGARALLSAGQNSVMAPSRELGFGARFHLVSQDGGKPGAGSKLVELRLGAPKLV